MLLAAAALHGKSRFVQARGLHSRRPATATARPHRHNITRKVCISGGRTGTGHGSNNSRCVDSGDTAAILPRNTRSGLRRVASMDTALWQYRIQSPELCRAQGCCGAHIALVTVAGDGGWCWWSLLEVCCPALRAAAGGRVSPGRVAGAAPRATGCTSTRLGGCGASCTPGRVLPGHGGYSCTDCTA